MSLLKNDTNRLPWYSFNKLLSHNGYYNMVLGARGTGKTYGAKYKGIKDSLYKGKQFIYVRRYKEELSAARNTFFADVSERFPQWDFRIRGNTGQAAHAETRDKDEREWKTICFFISLSVSGHVKSQSWPDVHLIIFDEFVIEKGVNQYLQNEVKVFNDFYSTVDRYKGQVRVLFLSNSVSINNPYFIEWNINPKTADEWIIKSDGFIVIHFHRSESFANEVFKTPFGKFIKNTDYADYAVSNFFADNHEHLIEPKSSEAKYIYSVELPNKMMVSFWFDIKKSRYYGQQKQPILPAVFTMIPNNVSENSLLILPNDKLLLTLKTAFRKGKMFFDKPSTRNSFHEVL